MSGTLLAELACVAVVAVVAGASAFNSVSIIRLKRSDRALRASLTGVQSVGRVYCPDCLWPLSYVPLRSPAEPSWWCSGCHRWIRLEPARSGELTKIQSGRIVASPNDQAGSTDTQATQTRETGVARE